MSSPSSWWRRSSRTLALQLHQLQQKFEHWREQLRDAVAEQLGQTVAGAVREAVSLWLEQSPPGLDTDSWQASAASDSQARWRDPEHDPWEEPGESWDQQPYREEAAFVPASRPQPGRLNQAVRVGCQTAVWWLRQRWGRLPLLSAVVLGSLAAAISYVGGPLGAAGLALAGSAVSLLRLPQPMPSGTATWSTP